MKYLKSYKKELKEINKYNFSNYYHIGYILPCNDTSKITTHIYFEIYYTSCNYEIYVNGLNIENLQEGGTVEHFTNCKPIKYLMPYTSYRYSKKQFNQAIDFILTNCNYLLEHFCEINTNIYLD